MSFENYYYIDWEKKTLDDIPNLNENHHYGFYQFYGYHPVYGSNSLLYIGKAQDNKFAIRLKDRWEFVESIVFPKYIHIGTLLKTDNLNQNNWDEMIDYIEKVLIRSHLPAMNCQNTKYLYMPENIKNIVIINRGDFGDLLPEISDVRVSYNEWNNKTPMSE